MSSGYHGRVSDPQDPQAAEPPIDPLKVQPPTQPTQPATRREARELAQSGSVAEATSVFPAAEQQTTALLMNPTGEGFGFETPPPARRGIFALVAKHPNAWLFSALGVVFVLLATGSVVAGAAVGASKADASVPGSVASPSATPSPIPSRPVPTSIAAAARLRTCSVAVPAADPNLFTFQGTVINTSTGEVLFDRNGATPSRTASVLKTLTAAAALAVLGPDYQISTKVYEGSTPGTVVLVGGGDPTLSALGAGEESVYPNAPKLSDLALQVKNKTSGPITDIVLDSTYWDPTDNWDPSWDRIEQSKGSQPEVTALTVDGGRANPQAQNSRRSDDPIAEAGAAFAADLGITGATHVTTGTAPAGAKLLGEVKSQPVRALVAYMLPVSDNTLGEYLARQTSKVAGNNGSSASLAQVIPAALAKYGLTTTGVSVRDGSGLSDNNLVPAAFVARLMAKVVGGKQNLNIVYDALPISGKTGTLASRFTEANAVARGAVNAKTGRIKSENSLAGVVHASDGTTLAFAFYALGEVNSRTIPALDTLTAAIFTCGNNLSNN